MAQVAFSCQQVKTFGQRPDGLQVLKMTTDVNFAAAKRGFGGKLFERWTEWDNGEVIYSVLVGPDAHLPITYGDNKVVQEETKGL